MPELPEVQTIKSQLSHVLPMDVQEVVLSKVAGSIVKNQDFELSKFKILKVERYGKILRFFLDGDRKIISGLGMSGSWRISKKFIDVKHTHVQFIGKNSEGPIYLGYIDPRRFGVMYFFNLQNEAQWLTRLGPDVSTADFNFEYLMHLKKIRPDKVIKPFMLEQNYFSGIGNYMASEICARAGIRPTRKMKSLKEADLLAIVEAVKIVLDQAINTGGTTFSGGYQDANGDKGAGVSNLVVFYQKICRLCNKSEVKKIILATRGTYYCPNCQR